MFARDGVASTVKPGQSVFLAVADTTFTVPNGVTKLSGVLVGKGGIGSYAPSASGNGAAGGDLRWINDLPVTPNESLTVRINANGTYLLRGTNVLLVAGAARSAAVASTPFGAGPYGGTVGGGNGGQGGSSGGGGAGGYSGAGGTGGWDGVAGTGGAGGGGGSYLSGGGGGGVGLLGQGANGTGGSHSNQAGSGGKAGSSGQNGSDSVIYYGSNQGSDGGPGGSYGGGGGGGYGGGFGGAGGPAAGRLIWGANRAFPSTNTGDM